jgi:hypothetical protein
VIVEGTAFTIVWATSAAGVAAQRFFSALGESDRVKAAALFALLANAGRIRNEEKFKNLGGGLWEFKSFQLRFLGDFRPGRLFVVAHAVRKKADKHRPEDLATGRRSLSEHDQGGVK